MVQTMCFAEGDTIQFKFNENNGEHKGKAATVATVVDSSSWVLGTAKGIRQVCASRSGEIACLVLTFPPPSSSPSSR